MHYGEPPPQHLYQQNPYPHQSGSNGPEINYSQIHHMNPYTHPMEAAQHSHQAASNYSMMPGPNHGKNLLFYKFIIYS